MLGLQENREHLLKPGELFFTSHPLTRFQGDALLFKYHFPQAMNSTTTETNKCMHMHTYTSIPVSLLSILSELRFLRQTLVINIYIDLYMINSLRQIRNNMNWKGNALVIQQKGLNRPLWVNVKLIPLKISLQGLQSIIELTIWLSESAAPEIYIPTTSLWRP